MPLGRAAALLLPLARLLQPVRDMWHSASIIQCLLFRCYLFIYCCRLRCPGLTPLANPYCARRAMVWDPHGPCFTNAPRLSSSAPHPSLINSYLAGQRHRGTPCPRASPLPLSPSSHAAEAWAADREPHSRSSASPVPAVDRTHTSSLPSLV